MKQRKEIENYLKTIYLLAQQGEVRGIRVAHALHLSRAAVSMMLKTLEQAGYLYMDERRLVYLSDQGLEIAKEIYNRYQTLHKLLLRIGVDPEAAACDACKLEHSISPESYAAIERYCAAIRGKEVRQAQHHL